MQLEAHFLGQKSLRYVFNLSVICIILHLSFLFELTQ